MTPSSPLWKAAAVFFAGTHGGGIFRSVNNGAGLTAVDSGLANTAVLSLAVSGGSVFAGTHGGGVFLSGDDGEGWTAADSGLTNDSVLSLAVSGSTILAGTHGGGVFLSVNNGARWTAINTGLTNVLLSRHLQSTAPPSIAGTDGGVWRRPLLDLVGVVGGDIAAEGTGTEIRRV